MHQIRGIIFHFLRSQSNTFTLHICTVFVSIFFFHFVEECAMRFARNQHCITFTESINWFDKIFVWQSLDTCFASFAFYGFILHIFFRYQISIWTLFNRGILRVHRTLIRTYEMLLSSISQFLQFFAVFLYYFRFLFTLCLLFNLPCRSTDDDDDYDDGDVEEEESRNEAKLKWDASNERTIRRIWIVCSCSFHLFCVWCRSITQSISISSCGLSPLGRIYHHLWMRSNEISTQKKLKINAKCKEEEKSKG